MARKLSILASLVAVISFVTGYSSIVEFWRGGQATSPTNQAAASLSAPAVPPSGSGPTTSTRPTGSQSSPPEPPVGRRSVDEPPRILEGQDGQGGPATSTAGGTETVPASESVGSSAGQTEPTAVLSVDLLARGASNGTYRTVVAMEQATWFGGQLDITLSVKNADESTINYIVYSQDPSSSSDKYVLIDGGGKQYALKDVERHADDLRMIPVGFIISVMAVAPMAKRDVRLTFDCPRPTSQFSLHHESSHTNYRMFVGGLVAELPKFTLTGLTIGR